MATASTIKESKAWIFLVLASTPKLFMTIIARDLTLFIKAASVLIFISQGRLYPSQFNLTVYVALDSKLEAPKIN